MSNQDDNENRYQSGKRQSERSQGDFENQGNAQQGNFEKNAAGSNNNQRKDDRNRQEQ